MYGVDIGYDTYKKKETNDEPPDGVSDITHVPKKLDMTNINVLVDTVSGDYAIVGYPLIYSKDVYDGGDVDMIELKEFTPEEKENLKKFILDKFGVNKDPKYIVLSHYT